MDLKIPDPESVSFCSLFLRTLVRGLHTLIIAFYIGSPIAPVVGLWWGVVISSPILYLQWLITGTCVLFSFEKWLVPGNDNFYGSFSYNMFFKHCGVPKEVSSHLVRFGLFASFVASFVRLMLHYL